MNAHDFTTQRKLPQVSGLQCITRPLGGAQLITLARVAAARGGPVPCDRVPDNAVHREERL